MEVRRSAQIWDLLYEVSKLVGVNSEKLLLATVDSLKFDKIFNNLSGEMPVSSLNSASNLYAYEVHMTVSDCESDGRRVDAY